MADNALGGDWIPISRPCLGQQEEDYLLQALRSTWVSSTGEFLNRFEQGLASFLGLSHGVATSNGTTALHLALAALGLGPGHEVLVPDLTFAATANAVLHAGATPVLVDSQPGHWNMDPEQAEAAVSGRTRAMVVVHLLGHPCPMEPFMELARRHSLHVVEDCAEALGATHAGRQVGTFGQIGAFSFYANKVITTGEGGLCATDDPALDQRMRVLRAHGMSREKPYWHEEVGFNYRMTNLNAALGLAQLEKMPQLLERRRALKDLYDQRLDGLPGLLFRFPAPGTTIDWLYPLFIDEQALGITRDEFKERLRQAGIDVRPMFYPLHLMPPFQKLPRSPSLQNSRRWGLSGLLLPLYPDLTAGQVEYITDRIAGLVRRTGS